MAKKKNQDFDIIVIGSGIAGTQSALIAAAHHKKVAIVEQDSFGGSSANYSDLPLSAMLKAAFNYQNAKDSTTYGLRNQSLSYNFPMIKDFKNHVVASSLVNNKQFFEEHNITPITGRAHFLTPNTITVNKKHYKAGKFIIATGSSWITPKIRGINTIDYLTPNTILNIAKPPKSLFVIGGNKTALEIAETFAILGTKVYLTEIASRLLPHFDQEVGDFMETHLNEKFEMIISTSSRVLAVEQDGIYKRVRFSHAGVEREVKVEQVLVADNQQPDVDLGLDNAAIKYSTDGIITDKTLKTSNKNVFAAGSVLGSIDQPHIAKTEATVATYNLLSLVKQNIDYQILPIIVNTSPKVAKIGFDEDDCEKHSLDYQSIIANFNEIPISNIDIKAKGFVKLIINNKKQLIGAIIVGPQADSLISQLTIAIQQKMTINQLATITQPFLTLSEIITVAAKKLIKKLAS